MTVLFEILDEHMTGTIEFPAVAIVAVPGEDRTVFAGEADRIFVCVCGLDPQRCADEQQPCHHPGPSSPESQKLNLG
jgi:hypothetical protein